ncbi:MAG: hypothetical protein HONDAALG_04473 [Gammaproteobacteria bacterium]|nr:hypothetical protein [Gammaproteobacteria bacterium]
MKIFDRRSFLSTISCSLVTLGADSFVSVERFFARESKIFTADSRSCWLDVCAPFIIEDAERDLRTEIILTSDTFVGARGHEGGSDATEYEIYLYDADGMAIGADGVTRRLTVPAMRTTVIPARELIAEAGRKEKGFWGGMRIRLRPRGGKATHASDLFSSAFNCWRSASSFDNVHANPDPPQWQNTESYFYSMPFPSLAEYECVFSLFNPYDARSSGEIAINDPFGKKVATRRYELKPRASLVFDLNANQLTNSFQPLVADKTQSRQNRHHGLLAITNEQGAAKSFGYLMIKQPSRGRFSVEHPIHQGVFKPRPAAVPFDAQNQFKAKNVLYTPLLFHQKKIGGQKNGPEGRLTLESRFYLGAGLPLEEAQWFYPFAVNGAGEAIWSSLNDVKLPTCLPSQTERGVIKLAAGQSCALDFKQLSLAPDFAGGLCVAVAPDTTHTLLKVEVRIPEWNAFAFTHFRPGLRSARSYQKPEQRGGLTTDYIVSGASLVKSKSAAPRDELIAVLNIDDQGLEARPVVELFGSRGLIARLPLGVVPPFACRHYLLSELFAGEANHESLTLRLVDERATLLMSAVHLDYMRRDLALDHGSDRFSTFLDYSCQ